MSTFFNISSVSNSSDFHQYNNTRNDISLELDSLETLGFGITNTRNAVRIINYCMGTLLALIGIAGVSGNGLVLYVFTKYRRLRSGGGPLILSLAAGDFGVSILHSMPAYSSFAEVWKFGYFGCELYAAAVGLGGLASLLTLSAIAADRFSVILGRPLTWLAGKKTVFFIWFVSFMLIMPPFFGWSRYVVEGMGTSCSWDYISRDLNNRLFYIFLLFFGFCVPVFVITVSYIGILRVVCKQSYQMSGVPRNGVVNKRTPTKSDLKTAQVILTIIFFFLIAWTPYAIVSFIGQFGDISLLSPLATAAPAIFAKASVIYNPIVYGLSHPQFRSAVRMLIARHWPNVRNTPRRGNNDHNNERHYRYRHAGGNVIQDTVGIREGDVGSSEESRQRNSTRTERMALGRMQEPLRRYGHPGMFCSDSEQKEINNRATNSDPGARNNRDTSQADPPNDSKPNRTDLTLTRKKKASSPDPLRMISAPESDLTAGIIRPLLDDSSGRLCPSSSSSEPELHRYNSKSTAKNAESGSPDRTNLRQSILFFSEKDLEYILQKDYLKARAATKLKNSSPSDEICGNKIKHVNNGFGSSVEMETEFITIDNRGIHSESDAKEYYNSFTNPLTPTLVGRRGRRNLRGRNKARKYYQVNKILLLPLKGRRKGCLSQDFNEQLFSIAKKKAFANTNKADCCLGNEKVLVDCLSHNCTNNLASRNTQVTTSARNYAQLKISNSFTSITPDFINGKANSIHVITSPWSNEDTELSTNKICNTKRDPKQNITCKTHEI